MTAVIVHRLPFGKTVFVDATVERNNDGSIMVLHGDTEQDWQRFAPGYWREVVVQDERDYPLFWFCAQKEMASWLPT